MPVELERPYSGVNPVTFDSSFWAAGQQFKKFRLNLCNKLPLGNIETIDCIKDCSRLSAATCSDSFYPAFFTAAEKAGLSFPAAQMLVRQMCMKEYFY